MQQRFIMTAFGHDRPGIVADVTQILYENGCNLEDTSMTLLAGQFTLIPRLARSGLPMPSSALPERTGASPSRMPVGTATRGCSACRMAWSTCAPAT
jgi:formyltetrahydrofolate hydrolase